MASFHDITEYSYMANVISVSYEYIEADDLNAMKW